MAAGAGDQRLYISRQHKLVVVPQADRILEAIRGGGGERYSDRELLALLGAGGIDYARETAAWLRGSLPNFAPDDAVRLGQVPDNRGSFVRWSRAFHWGHISSDQQTACS